MGEASILESVVVEWGPERSPQGTVIWLHGLGADGHDFEELVPHLGLPTDLRVRFVFPHAPKRPVTINGGMVMRAWYDILSMDVRRDEDSAGIRESAALVEALLGEEKARSTPPPRIVLAGFSQGGAIAYHVGLRHSEPLAGILVLSAYLLLEESLDDEAAAANRGTPVLQCHGLVDPVVPYRLGQHSASFLEGRGYAVDWRTYVAPHSLHPDEIVDVGRWLSDRLRQPG